MAPHVQEKASRAGQIRELLSELAALDGLVTRHHPRLPLVSYVDPGTGDRLSAGELLARVEREVREARALLAREERGQGHDEAAEQGDAVHAPTVALDRQPGELAP
ncbi:MAG: hypothetical protein Q8S73_43100 [Deltaproteobacteria bacterium]|nr:hypothetical protein [Myxococcales bacterium]MDP3220951.1 hypothetical protein [Deltaproteobacteria bacterium]